MKKIKYIIVIVVLILVGGYFYLDYIGSKAADIPVKDINFSRISDGMYTGEYKISPVNVITKTKISNGKIENIEIKEHFNGLGSEGEKVIPEIIKSQSLKVDTISSATTSSMAIIKSVEKSLEENQ